MPCINCGSRAYYGMEEKKALYCSKHRVEDTYNVMTKKCEFKDCRKIPTYGLLDGKLDFV